MEGVKENKASLLHHNPPLEQSSLLSPLHSCCIFLTPFFFIYISKIERLKKRLIMCRKTKKDLNILLIFLFYVMIFYFMHDITIFVLTQIFLVFIYPKSDHFFFVSL
jgi:Na+/H+ antiporter NhaB